MDYSSYEIFLSNTFIEDDVLILYIAANFDENVFADESELK